MTSGNALVEISLAIDLGTFAYTKPGKISVTIAKYLCHFPTTQS